MTKRLRTYVLELIIIFVHQIKYTKLSSFKLYKALKKLAILVVSIL